MDESDYMTLEQASRLLGVSRWTIYRRIDEFNIPVYTTPANRRVKLVKRADVEALRTPVPATGVARAEHEKGR